MKIVGPWVAIEAIQRTRTASGQIILPWQRGQEPTFAGVVLGIGGDVGMTPTGRRDVPFRVGDIVLIESQCGNPAGASEEPAWLRGDGRVMPGKTQPTRLDAGLFGGTPGRPAGLVPWHPEGLDAQEGDYEAMRRTMAIASLIQWEQKRRTEFSAEPDPQSLAVMQRHKQWLEAGEVKRVGRARSQLMKPTHDPGEGRGIIAVLGGFDDMMLGGFDVEHLADIATAAQ